MKIIINKEELKEFKTIFEEGKLIGLHLDYATNAIHCWRGQEELIIFRFKNFGWIHDNRSNTYDLTYNTEEITIEIHDRGIN
jgi:hypothetical protein